jgi:hypothetical protein
MDVGCALAVGIDDDAVDQLHEFIVGGCRDILGDRGALTIVILHVRQEIDTDASSDALPQKLGDRLHELHLGGHTKYGRSLGKDVLHDPRGDRLLGVGDEDQQASVFSRAALGLLHVIALEVPEQIEGLDPILAKRLVGNAEKPRQRAADVRRP